LLVVFVPVAFWLASVLVVCCCCPNTVGLTDAASTDVPSINANPTDNKNRNFLLLIKAVNTNITFTSYMLKFTALDSFSPKTSLDGTG
jgi:hypothetical protein